MLPRLIALCLLLPAAHAATTAAEIARAIRENSFDRDECYRVRDIAFTKEDIRIYFTQGYLIFGKPVAGKPIAAVFSADVEGGDGEVIIFPPDRAERRSLALFTDSPNLDEHIRGALLLFTGDTYQQLKAQIAQNPANRKAADIAPVLDDYWSPTLRNLGASYQTRLTYDLLGGPSSRGGLLAAMLMGKRLGNFDVVYEPSSTEQIYAGQLAARENRLYFDTWTSFPSRSARKNPAPPPRDLELRDYRIDATVNPDLSMNAVTRVKATPRAVDVPVAAFDMSSAMDIAEVKIDGRPAEVLAIESLRFNLTRAGNRMFLVVPAEPLRAGREYEFEFRYSGKVIHDAGEHVFFVSARGSWYPASGVQFATFDMRFRFPREYDLVTAGEVVEDAIDGEWRVVHRRINTPIRLAAFNLGDYEHARVERNGYVVDVCANRRLERALQPRVPEPVPFPAGPARRRMPDLPQPAPLERIPDPLERLKTLAGEVASALEFMASKFGPPALPHLTVSPIPGTFGQGFPGLIYLSTLSYINALPGSRNAASQSAEIFYQDMLQAHETAHQWWGNRVTNTSYRDNWLMEALANYSALLYLEKRRGARSLETMLDSYRDALLAKNEAGQAVDSAGPIVLGMRLESSQEPRAWRTITYGKGSWIIHMLRRRMSDERFLAMLAELARRYDRKDLTTEDFRVFAAQYLPAKSDDPKLESFFEHWVYGTGVPVLKLNYTVKNLKVTGTVTQTGVDDDFTTVVPIEIQTGRGKAITHWVHTASTPATFTVALQAPPLKVLLDPHQAVLRK